MTPEHYFCPSTPRFVAMRVWSVGTTMYGYSESSAIAAISDSASAIFDKEWGSATELRVYERTTATDQVRGLTFQVYRRLPSGPKTTKGDVIQFVLKGFAHLEVGAQYGRRTLIGKKLTDGGAELRWRHI